MTTTVKDRVEAANQEAFGRLVAADPVLVDVAPAGEVVEGLVGRTIFHAGPPVGWDRMCGAQRGAVIGMVLFEGWADTVEDAATLMASGGVRLEPNHHHHGVGPMAGTTSPSLPVWVVENRTFDNRAYCRVVEGRQQFGDYSAVAINALRDWRDVRAPAMRAVVRHLGGVTLKPIFVNALMMGDELHNRPNAASALFANAVTAGLVECALPTDQLLATLRWLAADPFLALGLSMASAKASAEPAEGVDYSTMVTAMARNGTDFGIRVSGLGDRWFTAPAPAVEGLYLPGFSNEDAGLDMGDSAITETVGWGGFVLGGAPGILALVGGTPEQALTYSREMRTITVGESPDYRLPALGFAPTAVGIDIRQVVHTGTLPVIDTAIAHREPGHPKIGGGLVRPPMACFTDAVVAFGDRYGLR